MRIDPFAVLGLPARTGVSDEDVRAAWRRIAAATHPDRDDGGDPATFGRAAAAYAMLKTRNGRGEALADLRAAGEGSRAGAAARARRLGQLLRTWASTLAEQAGDRPWQLSQGRHSAHWRLRALGRPGALTARTALAGLVSVGAFVIAGWSPATVGVLTGVLTWLAASRWHRSGG